EVLHADTEYLTQINTLMRPFRPQNRLVKDIDVHYHEAIITSDVAFLPIELDKFVLEGRPSLCIELKPVSFISQLSRLSFSLSLLAVSRSSRVHIIQHLLHLLRVHIAVLVHIPDVLEILGVLVRRFGIGCGRCSGQELGQRHSAIAVRVQPLHGLQRQHPAHCGRGCGSALGGPFGQGERRKFAPIQPAVAVLVGGFPASAIAAEFHRQPMLMLRLAAAAVSFRGGICGTPTLMPALSIPVSLLASSIARFTSAWNSACCCCLAFAFSSSEPEAVPVSTLAARRAAFSSKSLSKLDRALASCSGVKSSESGESDSGAGCPASSELCALPASKTASNSARLRSFCSCIILALLVCVKQGFIPVSTLVQEKVRRTWCRFCLMQFHLKKGRQYETRSQYCPCDLFSGHRNIKHVCVIVFFSVKSRMVSALMSLIQTPQNNLRVFKNGTPAYIVGNESPADLAACLREFFDIPPSSSSSTNAEVTDEQLIAGFVETLYQALTYEFKSLPVSDEAPVSASAEFSYPADSHYSQLCSRRMQEEQQQQQQQQQQPTQLSINCVLGRILSVQLLDRLGIDGTLSHYNRLVKFLQDNDTACRLPASELPDSVAHAKDPVSGRGLLMNLAIVDLDPKPFDKIRLNYKEDLEALRGFDATAAENHRQD
uniref:inositol-pentakisphosphate 2-kinase n=1 Tax=Macrostomum lignano TaxID=282301 RepID=A0A1I8J011_9PLAT